MSAMTGLLIGCLAASMPASASARQLLDRQGEDRPSRALLDAKWEEVASITGPDIGAASPGDHFDGDLDRIVLFDWEDRQLKAVSTAGRIIWNGGELSVPLPVIAAFADLTKATDGTYLVADVVGGKLLKISSAGSVLTSVPIPGIRRVVGLVENGGFVGWRESGSELVESFAPSGTVRWSLPLPEELRNVDPLAREVELAMTSSGDVILVAFRMASALYRVDLRGVAPSLEPLLVPEFVPFPETLTWTSNGRQLRRIVPDAMVATTAITASEDRFYVLFEGRTPDAGRLVDVYGAEDGAYEGTLRLPSRGQHIALVGPRTLAVFVEDPLPRFHVWRWTEERREGS